MQTLELVTFDTAGILDHAGDGQRVVRGELRENALARGEKLLDAGHVAEIGHGLAREHRIIGQAALLRAFDLGVPVGAFDQADGQPAAECGCRRFDPIDHRQRALLIGLHRQPETVEAAQRRIAEHRANDIERQFQPVGFFSVDRKGQRVRLGHARELDNARRQFRENPRARDRLEARMQGRELDRNSRARRPDRVAGARSDGVDGVGISVEVGLGVGGGARALAEHVERIAEFGVAAGPRQRFVDGLAEHEMRADEPHGLARRRAQRRQAEPLDDGVEDGLRRFAGMDDAGGDAERPSRSRNQQSRRFDVAVEPAAGRELVLDQPVGGGGIGHAQQRFGEDHQRQALPGRQRVSVQKVFDAAKAAGLGADRFDQRSRARVDAAFGCGVTRGLGQEAGRQFLVGRRVRRPERRQT